MENKELTLNEYQKDAMTTCMPSCENFSYMTLNLMGELGEFASKIGKLIRKEKAHIENSKLVFHDDVTDEEMNGNPCRRRRHSMATIWTILCIWVGCKFYLPGES